jgi:hypothetical protein
MLELDYNPTNVGMNELAFRIGQGIPARVILEPGDATRYEFLIIPQSGKSGDTFTGNSRDHLVVVRQTSSDLTACHVRKQKGDYWPGDFHAISNSNEHSANVMAGFFKHLMDFLEPSEATNAR